MLIGLLTETQILLRVPPSDSRSRPGVTARREARYGLVSICGAGATAAAMILERD